MGNKIAADAEGIRTVRHEYGHTQQLERMGLLQFTARVAIPSVTCNLLDRVDMLPCDYYSLPWEYQADMYGGVTGREDRYASWADDVCQMYFYPGTRKRLRFKNKSAYVNYDMVS